jgi:hypothetical protein
VITASSVCRWGKFAPRNAADLSSGSYFCSKTEKGAWISFDFKELRIEATHYTLRTFDFQPDDSHLKSWTVEGSNNGASWTEIDRRENSSDLTGGDVKTCAVWQPGSFGRIRLRQIGPNHGGNNCLFLSAFEVFGAVPGLQ